MKKMGVFYVSLSFSLCMYAMEQSNFNAQQVIQLLNQEEQKHFGAHQALSSGMYELPPEENKAKQTHSIAQDLFESVLKNSPTELQELVGFLQEWEKYKNSFPRSILLIGPPGGGKSTLAAGLGPALGIQSKLIYCANLANEYQNSGAKNLERELSPYLQTSKRTIIALDELSLFFNQKRRSGNPNQDAGYAFLSLYDQLERNQNIVLLATSNSMKDFTQPLKDRFTCIIELPAPSISQKKNIIEFHLNTLKIKDYLNDDDITFLAKQQYVSSRNVMSMIEALHSQLIKAPTITKEVVSHAINDAVRKSYNEALIREYDSVALKNRMKVWSKKYMKYIFNPVTISCSIAGLYFGYLHYTHSKEVAAKNIQVAELTYETNKKMAEENQKMQQYGFGVQVSQLVVSIIGLGVAIVTGYKQSGNQQSGTNK